MCSKMNNENDNILQKKSIQQNDSKLENVSSGILSQSGDESNASKECKILNKHCHLETNVLVFSLTDGANNVDITSRTKDQLTYFLSADCYTVYGLDMNNFMKDVWQDVTTCLCLLDFNDKSASDIVNQLVVNKILDYTEAGGRVIFLADDDRESAIMEILLKRISTDNCNQFHTDIYRCFKFSDYGSIVLSSKGRRVLQDSTLFNDILMQLSLTVVPDSSSYTKWKDLDMNCNSIHLLASDKQSSDNFLSQLMDPTSKRGKLHNMTFHVQESSPDSSVKDCESDNSVRLIIHELNSDPVDSDSRIDLIKYMGYLKTRELGRIIVHADVMESSFSAMESLLPKISRNCGLVISSAVQTKGRGRGSNKWISVLGTAMFTFHVTLSTASYIGQHPSLIQHLASLAVVLACKKCCGEADVNLAVKWPNDVYLRNVGKVAGVLVTCSHFGDHQRFMIGCGINVSNNRPTVCLHGAIKNRSSSEDKEQYLPSIEEVIAETLNQFESFLNEATDNKKGMDQIIRAYLDNWMHSDQVVRLSKEVSSDVSRHPILDSNEMLLAKVVGIDHFGFLQVEHVDALNRRRIYSLHPDGNSFDMMRNLILPKD